MQQARKLLIIGQVWPEPDSSAAGTRMLQLLRLFRQFSYEIVFACAAGKGPYSANLKAEGAEECIIKLNDSGFDSWLCALAPDVVLFDRFMVEEQYGWRVLKECPQAIRILDTEDLHFLRQARWDAVKLGKDFHTEDLFSDTAKREIAAILRSDLSLIISEVEMNLLLNQFRIDPSLLCYLPFLENEITPEDVQHWLPFEERSDFIFIGNFLHAPNWHAVQQLKKHIWPDLSNKIPGARLYIYGAYPSEKVFQLHQPKDRFLIMGRAEDARRALANKRVLLAPLMFGAGSKGKFIDAMHSGTPVVTTTIGKEGMNGNLEWNGFIADDYALFVKKAIELYQDKFIWHNAQAAGTRILNERYSRDKFIKAFIQQLSGFSGQLLHHRQHNFIGQLLQHHMLQSTRYMALWIEEKNKKT
ncbi:Glycosyltransferase involved in cell wall bisynthesis [bacterium A37T11]|nr:Glycosyltransferase involved in cell wall bisynthesis [bacterium A37T11]